MRILHADVGRKVAFVAVQTSNGARMVSVANVVVRWSLDGTAQASMTTPTVIAMGANMVGDFWLSIDELPMVQLPAGVDHAELTVHIEADSMTPVTRAIEIARFSPADDEELNTGVSPWQVERKREGTATVLSVKKLRDKAGTAIERLGVAVGSKKTS